MFRRHAGCETLPHRRQSRSRSRRRSKQELASGCAEPAAVRQCPARHKLSAFETQEAGWTCSTCSREFARGTRLFGCRQCDYDECDRCQRRLPSVEKFRDACLHSIRKLRAVDEEHSCPQSHEVRKLVRHANWDGLPFLLPTEGEVQRLCNELVSGIEGSKVREKSEAHPVVGEVSICIPVLNRWHHLELTLPLNLLLNWRHRRWAHFYVVDFGSEHQAQHLNWVLSVCRLALRRDFLRVFSAKLPNKWHCAVAKNAVHFLGCSKADRGGVLVNCDADNLLGEDFALDVRERFAAGPEKVRVVHYHGCEGRSEGTYGRIALWRETFERLGGYDEETEPAGCHDTDLIARAAQQESGRGGRFGPFVIRVDSRRLCQAIPNMKWQTVEHTSSRMKWGAMDQRNRGILSTRREEDRSRGVLVMRRSCAAGRAVAGSAIPISHVQGQDERPQEYQGHCIAIPELKNQHYYQ